MALVWLLGLLSSLICHHCHLVSVTKKLFQSPHVGCAPTLKPSHASCFLPGTISFCSPNSYLTCISTCRTLPLGNLPCHWAIPQDFVLLMILATWACLSVYSAPKAKALQEWGLACHVSPEASASIIVTGHTVGVQLILVESVLCARNF